MQDRVPTYPGRVKLIPVAGQENVYDMVRVDQPTQEGTPLNKNSLLKDATAALFQLGIDAVPDDVLAILSKSVLTINGQLQTPDGKLVKSLKYVHGYYDGETQHGTRRITVDFYPLMALVAPQSSATGSPPAVLVRNGYSMISAYDGGSNYRYTSITPSFGENYVEWNAGYDDNTRLNERFHRYYYFILGE